MLKRKIAYNTIVQVTSKIISTLLGLVAIGIMTRYLGKSGFGEYTTVITFISFFAIIADMGLTLITVQMTSEPGSNAQKILNNLFSLRLISALFFIGLAPLAVLLFPYQEVIKVGVLIASISFFFIALNQILIGIFQKNLQMDKVSIAEILNRTILLGGVFLTAYYNWGIYGIFWSMAIGGFVNFFLQFIFSRKHARLKFEFDKKEWKRIISRSWPLALIIIFNLIYLKADTLILSLVKSQEDVGIYGAAYKIIEVLTTLPFMFCGLILPFLTSNWFNNNLKDFKQILQKSFDFMLILAVPLVVATQFLATEIIGLIAGDDFLASALVLRILIVAAGLIFLATLFSHVIIALNKQKKLIGLYVFTSITSLIGYIIFIPEYSYIGAAWMTIYSEFMIAFFTFFYMKKFTKIKLNIKNFKKVLFSTLIISLGLYLLPSSLYNNWLGMLITICLTILVYFVILYLIKGIALDDIKSLLPKKYGKLQNYKKGSRLFNNQ